MTEFVDRALAHELYNTAAEIAGVELMSDRPRQSAIRTALQREVVGTPLSVFAQLVPDADPAAQRVEAELDDGAKVVFEPRTMALHGTPVSRYTKDGSLQALEDGVYRLKNNAAFQVVGGLVDFSIILMDPNAPPMNPHPPYGAWREVVAIMDDPLMSLDDPAAITDVIRVVANHGTNYYAVQLGLDKPYQAYVVAGGILTPLADGEYILTEQRRFRTERGEVHTDSLNDFKVHAHESTRLPL